MKKFLTILIFISCASYQSDANKFYLDETPKIQSLQTVNTFINNFIGDNVIFNLVAISSPQRYDGKIYVTVSDHNIVLKYPSSNQIGFYMPDDLADILLTKFDSIDFGYTRLYCSILRSDAGYIAQINKINIYDFTKSLLVSHVSYE